MKFDFSNLTLNDFKKFISDLNELMDAITEAESLDANKIVAALFKILQKEIVKFVKGENNV